MLDIGSQLKEARLDLDLTFQTIEEDTKISSRYLRAMEENNFSQLPGMAYAIGFLRIYSKYLLLDSEAIVKAFKESGEFKESPEIVIEPEEEENDTLAKLNRTPWQKWRAGVLVSLIFVLVAGGFLYYLGSRQPIEPSPNPVGDLPSTPSVPVVPDEDIQEPDDPFEDNTPEPVIQGLEIEITAVNGPCWLRAQGSTQTVEHNLKRGDRIVIEDDSRLKIKFGSAGAVEIRVNGVLQQPLGAVGAVIEHEYFAEQ